VFKSVGNLIVKIALFAMVGALIASFALFDASDALKGGGDPVVAEVGSEEIRKRELDVATYRGIFEATQGRGQPSDQMKESIQKRELNALIRQKIFDQELEHLGISVSEEFIIEKIKQSPDFIGDDGKFSRDMFTQYIRNNGLTESDYLHRVEKDLSSAILLNAITSSNIVTDYQKEILGKYEGEKRTAQILVIPKDYVKEVPEPDENALITYFDKHKRRFYTPEYRDISFITFGKENITEEIKVSDDEIRSVYEARKDEFFIPESKNLLQMVLIDETDAEKAIAKLKAGEDFYKVAEEVAEQDKEEVEFGYSSKNELLDSGLFSQESIDYIFSLEKNSISEYYESSFGFHIFKVLDKKEGVQQSFDDVKEELRKNVEAEHFGNLLYEYVAKIDDSLSSGSSLEEVSEEFDLEIKELTNLARMGELNEGQKKIAPNFGNIVAHAFKSELNIESHLISSDNAKSYYISRLEKVTPPRERALDEVRALVTSGLKKEQLSAALKKTSLEISRKLTKSDDALKTMNELVGKNSALKIEEETFIRESYDSSVIPFFGRKNLFGMDKVGESTSALMRNDGDYIVIALKKIIEGDKEEREEKIYSNIKAQLVNDMFEQYINHLQYKYPVDIYIE